MKNIRIALSRRTIYMVFLSLVAFTLVWTSRVDYTKSDPELTLLTTQALLQNGNINLHEYRYSIPAEDFAHGEWKYSSRGEGTIYYTYPLGNSVLAIPIVAIANLFGMDMSLSEHDSMVQRLLAAISLILVLILLCGLLSGFMEENAAMIIAPLLVFGSSLFSSVGTALWSFNFELVFLLLAVQEIIRVEKEGKQLRAGRLGTFLVLAWFCRPSAIVFGAVVFLWVMWKHRREVFRVAGPVLVFLVLFSAFSSLTYHQILPPYYNPFFWAHTKAHAFGYAERLIALLFSPARGLFIFTPVMLLAFSGMIYREVRQSALYRFALLWFILQWVVTATQSNWWGGWCFGPRMMTEALLPLSIMIVLSWKAMSEARGRYFRNAFLFLSAIGMYIHVYQGVFNHESYTWNDFPNIDKQPEYYIWNWDRSQLSANSTGNRVKAKEFELGMKLSWVMKQLPEQSVLLYGQQDAEVRSFLMDWNSGNGKKVYNNLYDIAKDDCDTFWITEKNFEEVSAITNFSIIPDTVKLRLGDYLRSMERYYVIMTVKDEASTSITNQTKEYMRKKGSKIDSLRYRQGYVACFDKGKLVKEIFETTEPASGELVLGNQKISFVSSGMDRQNRTSMVLNDREYSQDRRGFNVLVFDDNGNVIDIAWFDTLVLDEKMKTLFRVVKKISSQNRK